MMLRPRRRGQAGFTLIELLVVIAVLAILAGVVLFNVVGVTNRGETASCTTDVKTLQTAVDAFIATPADFPSGDTATTSSTSGWVYDLYNASPPVIHALTGDGIAGTSCTNSLGISGSVTSGYTVSGS